VGSILNFQRGRRDESVYGVLTLGALCTWLGYVGLRTLMSEASLSHAISSARARAVGPVLIVFIAVILLAEQLWPAVPRPSTLARPTWSTPGTSRSSR